MALPPTPSQTIGPFFAFALPYDGGDALVAADDRDAISIEGVVLDGSGDPVGDALVEIWQANRHGRYAHPDDARDEPPLEPGFEGFGRCPTDAGGHFRFRTVKPGQVPAGDGLQAPHIEVSVLARGLLKRLVTRIYFPDEPDANAADPALRSLDPESRATLIARGEGAVLRFDIRLQGEGETAFFEV